MKRSGLHKRWSRTSRLREVLRRLPDTNPGRRRGCSTELSLLVRAKSITIRFHHDFNQVASASPRQAGERCCMLQSNIGDRTDDACDVGCITPLQTETQVEATRTYTLHIFISFSVVKIVQIVKQ
jgi:hypothetical protein